LLSGENNPSTTARAALTQAQRRRYAKKSSIDFAKINRAALSCPHAICQRLVSGGKAIGHEYVVRNPTRADRRPGSFKVNLRTGKWADFATGDRGGDPVSLIAYVENCSQAEAARLLAGMLGIDCGGRQ
jgi:hypothetical protein